MEGARMRYRGFQEVRRADTPNQGLSGRQEPRQPPAKLNCTEQAATRLVGGRRLSELQRWRERICDDVGHGVSKYIIAAARDGTNKDLILTCEWFATRPEYFDGPNAGRATKKLGGAHFWPRDLI